MSEELNNRKNSDNYVSGPSISKQGDLSTNFIKFDYSFGYDCKKLFNLCVVDPNTIIFTSGNLINFFDVQTRRLSFRRCSTGLGIGHIAKNPTINHFAVGENGYNPPIIIYEWPSLNIVTILENGTTRSYSNLAYNSTGVLLASQGRAPDYLITIWDWKKSSIIIKCKSYNQDIYNIMFSPTAINLLTTCGVGHIKFWKIVETFTGLKLQGELGRWRKKEISDIIGVYPMSDEKVVSGFEWGNILIWDESLIKGEISQKNKKPCHTDIISQFEYIDGELISVGMDGWIRVWYYETIDYAEPSETDLLEIEPINELLVGEVNDQNNKEKSMLKYIQKKDPNDTHNTLWYAQDGNGGLWLIDLNTVSSLPVKIFSCHAGPIMDMDVSDWGPFVATCGSDGKIYIYNYVEKKKIFEYKFNDPLNKILWFSCKTECSGCALICASNNGILRTLAVNVGDLNEINDSKSKCYVLLQVLKPHRKSITAIMYQTAQNILVTGSEDKTIFVFQVIVNHSYPILTPIGYIKLPSFPTTLTWKSQNVYAHEKI